MITTKINLTIAAGAAVSEGFCLADVVGDAGLVKIPAAWTAATLGFKVAEKIDGTYAPLRDESGALVGILGIQAAEAGWYKLPDGLRGALYVKLWSMAAGVDTNQAAARSILIVAKG